MLKTIFDIQFQGNKFEFSTILNYLRSFKILAIQIQLSLIGDETKNPGIKPMFISYSNYISYLKEEILLKRTGVSHK